MQGESIVMILYALAVLPVIHLFEKLLTALNFTTKQLQEWFADDLVVGAFLPPSNYGLPSC
eukprot:11946452-Ditylum_brightwellii.AAC.1